MIPAYSKINEGMQMFQNMDSQDERFSKMNPTIQEALNCYKEIYSDKKNNCTNKN